MKKSRSVPVLIADDHPVVREGLACIINHEPDLQVVAEAGSWPEAMEKIAVHRPELAILDLRMPGMEAADAIPVIREKSPATRIIVLTSFEGDEDIYQALRAGATGYLPKAAGKEVLRECIRAVREGKTWIHPSAASKLVDRMQTPEITSREVEVLQFVAVGKSNKEIGCLLGIAESTIKAHVNHILAKLGVDGRVAATVLALQRGIVHSSPRPEPIPAGSISRMKN
jgi:two-component system NarL family response regulator